MHETENAALPAPALMVDIIYPKSDLPYFASGDKVTLPIIIQVDPDDPDQTIKLKVIDDQYSTILDRI